MDNPEMNNMTKTKKDKKIKTKEDYKSYMNEYMKTKYKNDTQRSKMYKNSLNIKKNYEIDDETWSKYGYMLYNIVKMKELAEQLPAGSLRSF